MIMASKYSHGDCKRTPDRFAVTEKLPSGELSTKSYCSSLHAAIGILKGRAEEFQGKASKTTTRLYSTATSIVKKLADQVDKEWKATEKAVK
jgi:hypothetical protein